MIRSVISMYTIILLCYIYYCASASLFLVYSKCAAYQYIFDLGSASTPYRITMSYTIYIRGIMCIIICLYCVYTSACIIYFRVYAYAFMFVT